VSTCTDLSRSLIRSLLKHIRAEKKLTTSFTSLGLAPKQAFSQLSDSVIGHKQTAEEPGEGVVDASDRLENGEVIVWWNNLEKDSR
jgi:UDP-glucose:glycoprotein glucosyltransferase